MSAEPVAGVLDLAEGGGAELVVAGIGLPAGVAQQG